MIELQRRGAAVAVVCSEPFVELARTQSQVFGASDLPLIIISHPVGGLSATELRNRAESALPQISKLLRDLK